MVLLFIRNLLRVGVACSNLCINCLTLRKDVYATQLAKCFVQAGLVEEKVADTKDYCAFLEKVVPIKDKPLNNKPKKAMVKKAKPKKAMY